MNLPTYKHDKTRLDVIIKDDIIQIASNYECTAVLKANIAIFNLLNVFKKPENYVLYIHDNRKNKSVNNLTFNFQIDNTKKE